MNNHKNMASVSADAGSCSAIGSGPAGPLPGWRDTFLASSQYFYPLPAKILDEIEPLLSPAYCQGSGWQLERQLTSTAPAGAIGFWNGQKPLQHPLLQRLGTGRVGAIHDLTSVAYCGWLGGCRQFLREHDDLLAALPETMDMTDPLVIQHGPLHVLSGDNSHMPTELVQRYRAFCHRWRLEGLIGPYVPVPTRLTHQVLTEPVRLEQPLSAGLLLHIPDIYGHLTANSLARIQRLLADQTAQHLAGWHRIVHASNRNRKKQLGRYAKSFLLRHYWNTVWQRYGSVLVGHRGLLQQVLAGMFRMKPSTVRWHLGSRDEHPRHQ